MNNSGVQVERTGGDQREAGFIHAEDVREYLLTLGISEQQIAIKTSEKNDLKEPENLDLLSPTNQIRFIITRQALQEGWDCPFAYVLCFHATTRDVVDAIKKGLEQDGMSDLADRIRDGGGGGNGDDAPRLLTRRGPYRRLKIYLPIVNRVEGDSVRPLDYERDILYRIDWDQVNLNGLASLIPEMAQDHEIQIVQVGLAREPDAEGFVEAFELGRDKIQEKFDPVYVVRSISDIVPNPWVARVYVDRLVNQLSRREIKGERLGSVGHLVLETLRAHLSHERDRLAETIFMADVTAGCIQFRLRTDRHNWVMPDEMTTQRPPNGQELRRDDGQIVQKNLFEATYKDDLNGYEQSVACYPGCWRKAADCG